MKKYHHTTEDESRRCNKCNRPSLIYWDDAEEKNGRGEVMYGIPPICVVCYTDNNNGRPPLGLTDLNEIRKRGITEDQYYREHGY